MVKDPSEARGLRVKSLMPLYQLGDKNAEAEIVDLLRESIKQAGDKQPDRASWLGISPRYLRELLSEEVGLTKNNADLHGRGQGFKDTEKKS